MTAPKKERQYSEAEVLPADQMLESSTVGKEGVAEVNVIESSPVGDMERPGVGIRLESPVPAGKKADEKTGGRSGEKDAFATPV